MLIATKVSNVIKDHDIISSPGYVHFHLEGDEKSRSIIGGIISMILNGFLLFIIIDNGIRMFSLSEPYTASFTEKMDTSSDQSPFMDMSKILLEITEGTPDLTIDISEY